MVEPNPPSARMVSQWRSSFDRVPSAWLWQFVKGASMKRFFMAGPRVKLIGWNRSAWDKISPSGGARTP